MRTRLAPLVLVPLLALTGCSSGSGGRSTALGSTPSPSAAATATPAATTPAAAGASAAARAATSAPTAQTSTVTSAAPVTTVAPGRPATRKATAPGVYTSDSSGTIDIGALGRRDAKGTQTLTISALKGDTQHSSLHGDQGDTDQDLLVRDTGTYVADLTVSSPAFGQQPKEFRPYPAVLLLPDPAKVGAAWSWSAVSTDGKTHVSATNQVARTETVTIGGKAVPCVVVQTHLVLSGDVSYDAQVTTWYAPAYRLPVKDHTVGKGTYAGTPFTTDITTQLRSVTPS